MNIAYVSPRIYNQQQELMAWNQAEGLGPPPATSEGQMRAGARSQMTQEGGSQGTYLPQGPDTQGGVPLSMSQGGPMSIVGPQSGGRGGLQPGQHAGHA